MRTHHRHSGLTLVELLVVLAILIILTTVAISATDQFLEQARHDATQRTLQSIQDAIMGPANQRAPDGSMVITGFVSDMGRLPTPVFNANTIVGDPLRELWDATAVAVNSGPIPRSRIFVATPWMMNPPIMTLSPVWTVPRVEIWASFAC